MKKRTELFLSVGILLSIALTADAAVLQSAKDVFSNDIFVPYSQSQSSAKAKHNIKSQHNTDTASENKTSTPKTSASEKENTQAPSSKPKSSSASAPQNPDAGYGYTQKYASKLFKSYSGYITVEQKDIPKRLSITKGSTLQINLIETPDSIWNVELDENIGKITINKVQGNRRILVIHAINTGSTRLFLDNVSIKDNKYRVIFSKKMSLTVEE